MRREIPHHRQLFIIPGFFFLDGFRKVFQRFSKSFPKSRQSFPDISEHFRRLPEISEIAEYFLGKTDDVSMTQGHILVLFKGLFNHRTGDHITFEKKKHVVFTCEIL